MAIKPVTRDLTIGKKTDQWELAQRLADQPGLDTGIAEQCRTACDAADVHAGFWWSVQPAGELPDHADHITPRALGIAATEHDRITRGDLRAEYKPTATGVDRQQIANKVVAGVRTGDRQSGKNQAADAAKITGELRAGILAEDRERGASVDDHHDVVARLVDPTDRSDRHAPLGQGGSDRNPGS